MAVFESVMLRLKERVGVPSDKGIAELLGMTDKALNARKRRDAFPDDKLFALAAKRPELKLDVPYILTGQQLSTARETEGAYMIRANAERAARGEPEVPGLVAALQGLADTDRRIAERAESMALVNHYLSALDDEEYQAALEMLMRYGRLRADDRLAVNRMVDGLAAARR